MLFFLFLGNFVLVLKYKQLHSVFHDQKAFAGIEMGIGSDCSVSGLFLQGRDFTPDTCLLSPHSYLFTVRR
jgi:hypothetical protein